MFRKTAPLCFLVAVACGGSQPVASPPPVATAPPPAPPPAPTPPSFTGIWRGPLHLGPLTLHMQLRLDTVAATCTLDSLEQHAGLPCTATVAGDALSVDIPDVHATLKGTAADDGNSLKATFVQGGPPVDITMTKQAKAIDPKTFGVDAARPALDADLEKLKAVLDYDLTDALARGDLAPATGNGVVIGVVAHGVRAIYTYGTAKPDSVFEIGSVTKTFTGLLLAQMKEQKKVRLDEPVRALLPKGAPQPAPASAEITLVDLSAQRSGLPRLPPNLVPKDVIDPYATYDAKALYEAVQAQGLARPETPKYDYSNFGVGLLGQLLADRAASSYEALLTREITRPLGMHDTAVTLTPALAARLLPGHDGAHKVVPPWTFKALAGAGAIHSTAADMLTFLEAQLHPEHLPKTAATTPEGKTLAAAITASHVVQGDAGPGMHIALNWHRIDETGSYWHNGATGGFSSYAQFNVDRDYALVVLTSTSISEHTFADDLGHHVAQRLTGKPAVSLFPPTL